MPISKCIKCVLLPYKATTYLRSYNYVFYLCCNFSSFFFLMPARFQSSLTLAYSLSLMHAHTVSYYNKRPADSAYLSFIYLSLHFLSNVYNRLIRIDNELISWRNEANPFQNCVFIYTMERNKTSFGVFVCISHSFRSFFLI